VEVRVPSLRDRKEDIAVLSKHFLERHASHLDRAAPALEPDGLAFLESQPWPGNVRELEMLLLRMMIKRPDLAQLEARDLRTLVAEGSVTHPQKHLTKRTLRDLRRDLERRYLTELFFEAGGDIEQMMRELDVKSTKLYAWLHDLGLDIRQLRRQLPPEG
jgi:two-component system nitrogen regulation response regulator NtrX